MHREELENNFHSSSMKWFRNDEANKNTQELTKRFISQPLILIIPISVQFLFFSRFSSCLNNKVHLIEPVYDAPRSKKYSNKKPDIHNIEKRIGVISCNHFSVLFFKIYNIYSVFLKFLLINLQFFLVLFKFFLYFKPVLFLHITVSESFFIILVLIIAI